MSRTRILIAIIAVIISADTVCAESPTPTFSGEVAQIVHKKCAICHRTESSGPFSLISYDDVKQHSATIEAVLANNYMPPWKPLDHGIPYTNDRSLTSKEKQTIVDWIEAGCPEGRRDRSPTPPQFPKGWTLGEPDLIVRMNGRFEVPADGPDIYRSFVFPLKLAEDKWVKAIELRPQATSAMHHAIFFIDPSGNARQLDGADGAPGINGMGFLSNFGGVSQPQPSRIASRFQPLNLLQRIRGTEIPDRTKGENAYRVSDALAGSLGGYVPGATPNLLPPGLSMHLPQGSDIVMQTHFHPSGKVEIEQADLALYFADRPSQRQLTPIMVPPMFGFGSGIKIPPGEKEFIITDSFVLPVDTQAISVAGHAHYTCSQMRMTATSPDGRQMTLLEIDDWDLDWQDQYQFAQPLELVAGTVLHVRIAYDNSGDNPENPFNPPREIRWGRGSSDEMGSITLMTVAKQLGDEAALRKAVRNNFASTITNRSRPEMIQMLMQMDDNHDGKLQLLEAPARLDSQTFKMLDTNGDGGIDEAEFERAFQRLELFQLRR